MTEVKILDNILPKKINQEVIEHLCNHCSWFLANEKNSKYHCLMTDQKELGFSFCSHETNQDLFLNTFAKIVFYRCIAQLKIEANLSRFMWNMYFTNQASNEHIDMEDDDYLSILYNLNTTSGGTKINNNFYKDVEGQAKIFKSNLKHQGIGPKEHPIRFNLNIVFKKM